MILDEYRDSLVMYEEMLQEGRRDPMDMLNIVDKKLADIANHIAICHRVVAEERAEARAAFLPSTRDRHFDKADRAGEMLENVIAVQDDLFDFRYKVLCRLADFLRSPNPGAGASQREQCREWVG